ncbi:response regulator receiver protein [Pirellula staleyi DSM 6068]|uniref:Response regulator receiver protein n=1 Tax=Pirellula staleyi (strain ATCC 27377 / DSM 6068 / ICPB 4128) TaxID=530564 RepID=D2R942_PIRSD|nr:AAA family ATPase [Pirellula staleyi]ADB15869.1 response regulator receiver protein [Pirellula staleyi DSM 6068]
MAATPNILIISADPKLHEELQSALRAMGDRAPVAHFITETRQGIEAARSRSPDLVLVEMGRNLAALKSVTMELNSISPEMTVAAVFRPDVFGNDVSESAIVIEAIRAGVKDFLRRPVSTVELQDLLDRTRKQSARVSAPLGRVISFISNKGGVGKSTLAVNSACGLAQLYPGRVLLIDASLQLGVAASMLDLNPSATLTDAVRESSRLDEMFLRQLTAVHESGLHVLAAPRDAIEAAEVDDESISRIITLGRRSYDFVIVDTFPLFDRVVIAILDLSDRAYVVLENVVPTLLGAAKLLELLGGLGFPKERQRVIVNRFQSISGGLSLTDAATKLERTIDFALPYDKRIMVAANTGRPYAMNPSRWFGIGPTLKLLISDLASLAQMPRTEMETTSLPSGVASSIASSPPSVLSDRGSSPSIREVLP